MPEKSGLMLGDASNKLYIFEVNLRRLIDYDREWSLLRVGAFSATDLVFIYCLSKKLEKESPVPKLPLLNRNPTGKCGWEGSTRFISALEASKQLRALPPDEIPAEAAFFVLNELDHLASSSMMFTSLAKSTEEMISSCCSTESILCGSCSSDTSASTFSGAGNIKELTSPIPSYKRRNPVTKQKLRTAHHSNKGGVTSHKKVEVKLGSSTKEIMRKSMTGLEAMSLHGSLLTIRRGFTPFERWWLKHLVKLIYEKMSGLQVQSIKEVILSTRFKEPLHKVCSVTNLFYFYYFISFSG
jgi:hypothetical protein